MHGGGGVIKIAVYIVAFKNEKLKSCCLKKKKLKKAHSFVSEL